MFRTFIFIIALFVGLPSALADSPLPAGQWTPAARYNLARCLVGESGWDRPDHAAIPWALFSRWEERRAAGETISFEAHIWDYCAMFELREPSPRQRWVLALPDGEITEENEPPDWPSNLVWMNYASLWRNVFSRVDAWAAGHVSNPCPGVVHWGGTIDHLPTGAIVVCSRDVGSDDGMRNTFYFIDPGVRRELARCAALRARYTGAEMVPVEVSMCDAGVAETTRRAARARRRRR
jgi:hypothetical protein